jgi:DNA-binding NarL/FixJ family response regulator
MPACRILLADHQALFRSGLASTLAAVSDAVVLEAAHGSQIEVVLHEAPCDIIFMDRYLPGIDAMAFCEQAIERRPELQIVLLVPYEAEAAALQYATLLQGGAGCLSKELEPAAYIETVHQLRQGHVLFDSTSIRRATRRERGQTPGDRFDMLTVREHEVLRLVATGQTNQSIASKLGISYHTVLKHISNIFSKLHVSSRVEAALLWQGTEQAHVVKEQVSHPPAKVGRPWERAKV